MIWGVSCTGAGRDGQSSALSIAIGMISEKVMEMSEKTVFGKEENLNKGLHNWGGFVSD